MLNTETIKNLGLKDIHTGATPDILNVYLIWGFSILITLAIFVYVIFKLVPIFKVVLRVFIIYFKSKRYPQEINLLLKNTATMFYGNIKVAGLIGEDWLKFLDHKSLSKFTNFKERWNELLYSGCEITRSEKFSLMFNTLLWLLSNFWRVLWLK